jgi:WD40 repeat protein
VLHEASRLQVTPDGGYAVSAGWRPEVHIWDIATGRSVRVLEGHTKGTGAIAISPDGTSVLTADADHAVRVWELDWELEPPALAPSTVAPSRP